MGLLHAPSESHLYGREIVFKGELDIEIDEFSGMRSDIANEGVGEEVLSRSFGNGVSVFS